MRYSLYEHKTDDDHPLWPNLVLYKVADSRYATEDNPVGYISCTGYLSKGHASRVVEDLNKGIGWIT